MTIIATIVIVKKKKLTLLSLAPEIITFNKLMPTIEP